MFKIGEFSKINHITVKTLHHYDDIGLLKPSEIDEWTGYRLYSSDQLLQVQQIIALKQLGFSLKEVKEIIANQDQQVKVLASLDEKVAQLQQELTEKQHQLQQLDNFISFLRKEQNMPEHITIKELPEVLVACKRVVIKDHSQLNQEMPQFGEVMARHDVKCAKPDYCFNLYHDGEYRPTDIDVEMCQAVTELKPDRDGVTYQRLAKVPQAACIYHRGSYATLGQTYAALMKWLDENDFEMVDLPRESYIDGIWNKVNETEWLTEIQAPIKKK